MNKYNVAEDKLIISKLTNEELRDKIINVNKKQLSIVRNMSYYYLFGRIGEVIQLVNDDKFLNKVRIRDERKIILESIDVIIDSFKNYHKELSNKEIEDEIDILLNIREKLFYLSNSLYSYRIELSYVKELLDHKTMKVLGEKQYKKQSIDKRNISLLINKINETLDDSNTDYNVFTKIVSNILSVIPFRMSKYKYFDIIKSTLVRNLNYYTMNVVENKIEEYKNVFDSTLMGDYGVIFDNYFTNIQRFKNMISTNNTLDELEDIAKDIKDLNMEINKVNTSIDNLGIIVNRLIVLYLSKNKIDISSNIRNDFKKWKEYNNKRKEELLESLLKIYKEKMKENERKLLDKTEYFDNIVKEGVDRKLISDNSLNDEITFTSKVLTYYNDVEFTKYEALFTQEHDPINNDDLKQLVESLIQYINRSISSMSNLERKIRMRRLLSTLELPFENIEEFLSYIEYSLDEKVTSIEEIAFAIGAVDRWLDEYIERR